MKHTPGPWYALNYAGYISIQNEDGYSENDLLNEEKCPDAEANGKLMAAAPDLLAALQAMDELNKLKHLSTKWWKQAEKCNQLREYAIKKATE